MPFCQGAWTLVRSGFSPVASKKVTTASWNVESRLEDSVPAGTRFGEGLAQLLDDPLRCRVDHQINDSLSSPACSEDSSRGDRRQFVILNLVANHKTRYAELLRQIFHVLFG